jgi:hypothetical protein
LKQVFGLSFSVFSKQRLRYRSFNQFKYAAETVKEGNVMQQDGLLHDIKNLPLNERNVIYLENMNREHSVLPSHGTEFKHSLARAVRSYVD